MYDDGFETTCLLQRSAEAEGDEHEGNRPHHRLDAAAVQQAVDLADARLDGIAAVGLGEDVVQTRSLRDHGRRAAGEDTGQKLRNSMGRESCREGGVQ